MASLEVSGVDAVRGSQNILNGIDLCCKDGEFMVLVGPSGCGKSTLLNIIAGLDPPLRGRIRIGGQDVTAIAPKDRDIAMVFQSYALYPTMTVRENMGFGLEMRGVPKPERERKIVEAAKALRIESLLDRRPSQLSGGQRQRAAMGRALVRNPAVFLFDEPLSNLDAHLRVQMRTEIKTLHQRLRTTTLFVTHDQIEAMTLATSIAVMKDGSIQQVADPQTLYDSPKTMYVAGFIGSPAMNFLPALLRSAENGKCVVELDRSPENKGRLSIALDRDSSGLEGRVGGKVIVGIRPENITEYRAGMDAHFFDALEVEIEVVEPTGSDTLAVFLLGGREVTARVSPESNPRPGHAFRLAVRRSKTVLFDPETGYLL